MIVEYLLRDIEQIKQHTILDEVIHGVPVFSSRHHIASSKDGQLLGKIALLNIQSRAQVIDAHLSHPEFIQNPNPQGMGERLKEFRLEVANFSHQYSYIIIFI